MGRGRHVGGGSQSACHHRDRRRRIEPLNQNRRPNARARQHLERHLGHRRQPSPAARHQFRQIIARDILDDLATADEGFPSPAHRPW